MMHSKEQLERKAAYDKLVEKAKSHVCKGCGRKGSVYILPERNSHHCTDCGLVAELSVSKGRYDA